MFIPFSKGITPTVNVKAQLEFELVLPHLRYYAMSFFRNKFSIDIILKRKC